MAGRFNPAGRFLRAWGSGNEALPLIKDAPPIHIAGATIIDCMLNLPLLYWASDVSEDPRFKLIAMQHADTTMEHFIRPDGSIIHIVEFDPVSGAYVSDHGGQGYGKGSSWTRGQAWGLYGFTASYKHTGMQKYLDTAKKLQRILWQIYLKAAFFLLTSASRLNRMSRTISGHAQQLAVLLS